MCSRCIFFSNPFFILVLLIKRARIFSGPIASLTLQISLPSATICFMMDVYQRHHRHMHLRAWQIQLARQQRGLTLQMALLLRQQRAAAEINRNARRAQRAIWVRSWIQRRDRLGAYRGLMRELNVEDIKALKNFLRMNGCTIDCSSKTPTTGRHCHPGSSWSSRCVT